MRHRLMGALAERAMEPSVLNELKAREVANIAWAFATLNIKEPTLMNALANRCAAPDVVHTLNAQVCRPPQHAWRRWATHVLWSSASFLLH